MFSMLNDDCVDQILDRLALRDICHLSRTCKRLHALCANHFRRKYPVEATEVTISVRSNGNCLRYADYVRYFSNFIKDLSIYSSGCEDKSDLSCLGHFVKSKCHPNLHRIKFVNEFKLRPSFCEDIECILRNVKVVRFEWSEGSGQMTEVAFLRYCPSLTRLVVDGHLKVENVTAVLRQKYGQLNSFYYLDVDGSNLDAAELKTFFQTNDRIRCVALKFCIWNADVAKDRAAKWIQTLDYAANLQHLFLTINDQLTEIFNQIVRVLDALCERENFQTLELGFDCRDEFKVLKMHNARLVKWKQLTKIHLERVQLIDVLPELRSLVHLRILVLKDLHDVVSWTQWSNWDELAGIVDRTTYIALPQIEEVQLENWSSFNGKTVPSYVMQFARHWINLKRILLVPACGYSVRTFDIAELNRARQKLNGACELTIFTENEGNTTSLENQLVKLKLVKFLEDPDDPFQEYRCIQRMDKNVN